MPTPPAPAALAARLQAAPRCHAHSKRTRQPCRAPAVRGFAVCRFHGARGGARRGNRNAWKHGVRGAAWAREAAGFRALVRGARRLVSASKSRVHGVVRSNCAGDPPPTAPLRGGRFAVSARTHINPVIPAERSEAERAPGPRGGTLRAAKQNPSLLGPGSRCATLRPPTPRLRRAKFCTARPTEL